MFLLLKDESFSMWNLTGGRKSNHLEGRKSVGKADGWLSELEKFASIAEQAELPYGISLAGTRSQPQKKS